LHSLAETVILVDIKIMEEIIIFNFNEIIGIIASGFVLISFLYSGEWKIRIVNIIGSILFVIYGILIGALSVYLMNGILIIVHISKLIKLKKASNEEHEEQNN